MATTPVSPRSRGKREQIRAAAKKLFLANGVAGTSMEAITAEASVSKQTVYAHFESKAALLRDILETLVAGPAEAWREFPAAQAPLRSRDDLEEQLGALAHMIVDSLMQPEYLATARVIVAECGRNPELGDLFRQAVADPVLAAVAAVVERAVHEGVLRDEDPQDAARLLVGPLLTFVLLDGLLRPESPQRPSAAQVSRFVAYFVDALVRR